MVNTSKTWSKHELKIYMLLLCGQADSMLSQEELNLIKSKTDNETFESLYREFKMDNEDISIQKIETSVGKHQFSHMELADLKKEFNELFNSDSKFSAAERYLSKILDNIVY
ncbi:hypothetical protein ACOCEA_07720 [Maribacter sp. CXY002]|uniref:hypothetical protein n=1 Tax=Maribacter luteocoastalis TaxID=3407671 RepID=UPI003B67FC5D